ncbi:hypothetical protein Y032_0092g2532 [Ancylostoma ceylanicum]|uniref:Uncharacterized protein n=1 Tax=Ancylostoma ceylanicum TaxID=53326 RepID=A0A016TLS0_9BILA|nr:hypothetical protein Y032_0092g2532 [Ancylostoma ceylanicum]
MREYNQNRKSNRYPLENCVYLSGAIVLPASKADFENVKKSIKYAAGRPSDCKYHYNALAILLGAPPSSNGSLSGYATFQSNGRLSEYIFVEKPSSKRARTGKFAVAGSMEWRVLSQRHGCSLVEFKVDKCGFLVSCKMSQLKCWCRRYIAF